MTMAMSGSYRIVSEGHAENVIIDFEMDDDCEVEYELVSSELVPSHETAKMREGNVPPHTYLYRLFSDGPVSGEVMVGTFPGIDMRAVDTSRFNELFASMVNFLDNHALFVFFEKEDLDKFINDYCPY